MAGAISQPCLGRSEGGSNTASEALDYLPMVILGGVAFLLVFATLVGNRFLGPKRASVNKVTSYECGEKATPGARGPIDVQYYMYALTFLIFDVEAMFLIPFVLKFKDEGIVTVGAILAAGVFVGLILVGYAWELSKRILDWRSLEGSREGP